MKKLTLVLSVMLTTFALQAAARSIDIIPKPQSIKERDGIYGISEKTTIGFEKGLEGYAGYLSDIIFASTGLDLDTVPFRKADIKLAFDGTLPEEGYLLDVCSKGISVTGADMAGVFYGIQSLLQLFPVDIYSGTPRRNVEWNVPCVSISDFPERPWRGMMLDVARYFYDVDFVKKYVDMMAMYKLNKLQLHLIDDSGWRVEIRKYPELTSVGAWAGAQTDRLGGYYTQDEIRELVEYAAFRNVEIVPELEFPAHILSAVVAYPWLCCTGEQHSLPEQHFISRDLICAGKESSYEFLENVLDELVGLFPSEYVNIGGDEAVYDRWNECPHCQALMRREGIEDASRLQGYMVDRVTDMLKERGRKAVGWEEIIMRGELKNRVTALVWHDVADSLKVARAGHKAILTPASHTYFDFPESSTPGEVKAAVWMPPISVRKCYDMPVNDYSDESTVIGVQGCFWTDQFIHGTMLQEIGLIDENRSERYAEYLTFPRLLALSEIGWISNDERDYDDFTIRLGTHYGRLEKLDCGFRVPEPRVTSLETMDDGSVSIAVEPSVVGSVIRYTTDGSYPTVHSAVYEGPVTVAVRDDFKAITVLPSGKYSLPVYFEPDYSSYKEYGTFVAKWSPETMLRCGNVWKTECSGRFRGNGTYEITLVWTGGDGDVGFSGVDLLKKDLKVAGDVGMCRIGKDNRICKFEVTLNGYEAGTPFFLSFGISDKTEPYTEGLVFIRSK